MAALSFNSLPISYLDGNWRQPCLALIGPQDCLFFPLLSHNHSVLLIVIDDFGIYDFILTPTVTTSTTCLLAASLIITTRLALGPGLRASSLTVKDFAYAVRSPG